MSCHAPAQDALPANTADIALIGSPNCGKSTLFNRLTGLTAQTGNYPGVTVTRSRGIAKIAGETITLTDLPGTYSLTPASPDEQVVIDHIHGNLDAEPTPGALLLVADSTTLKRSLALHAQVLALGRPTALVLTMVDELRAGGGDVNIQKLSQALGIPVVETVAHKGRGIEDVKELLSNHDQWPAPFLAPPEGARERNIWIDSVLQTARWKAPQAPQATRGIDRFL